MLLNNTCGTLLQVVLHGKMLSIFLSPYREFSTVLCFKNSATKGFLQMCSKFTGQHPRGNITLQILVHCQVMLLKGALRFHPYTTSLTKPFCGCRRMPDCFEEVNVYQRTNRIEYCERKLRYTKEKLRCSQAFHMEKTNKQLNFPILH